MKSWRVLGMRGGWGTTTARWFLRCAGMRDGADGGGRRGAAGGGALADVGFGIESGAGGCDAAGWGTKGGFGTATRRVTVLTTGVRLIDGLEAGQIGRASCRERVS